VHKCIKLSHTLGCWLQVLEAVLSGQRLARPPGCPREMYALMLSCWASDPTERPTFRAILTIFK